MTGPQFQREARRGGSPEDIARTGELWRTTSLSATQIGLLFTPQVTKNVILGRVKRLGLIGYNRIKPTPAKAIKLPPPEKRPKPVPRRSREDTIQMDDEVIRVAQGDKTPEKLLARFRVPTPTMKPWIERKWGECAYPIDVEGQDLHSCCAPVRNDGCPYCAAHARACLEAPPVKTRPLDSVLKRRRRG